MCGILCIFHRPYEHSGEPEIANGEQREKSRDRTSLRERAFQQSSKQRHRGPDHTGVLVDERVGMVMVQERLAVLGVKTGNQPFTSNDGMVVLVANGEIYNYLQLASMVREVGNYPPFETLSDCYVLIAFYQCFGAQKLIQTVRGMFAFVLYDRRTHQVLVMRDPIGIVPLYTGRDDAGRLWIASELKCLVPHCHAVAVFPPGHYYLGAWDQFASGPEVYFSPRWITEVPCTPVDLKGLRERLEAAVESHLQCDVPLGALLSGGLDSSLIAAIASRLLRRLPTGSASNCLKTYSIGLPGTAGSDLAFARTVADFIGSEHTEVHFELEEGLDYIRHAVYHAETYDVTTIRCIVPLMLLARHIRSEGIKVVLSGEGADELFGGYLYFHRAPSVEDFHRETVRRVQGLHYSDCLRANKGCAAWGLELRVPFLDTDFLRYVMDIRPEDRAPRVGKPEKYILRQAFAEEMAPFYLPPEVLWRQKEQFSDGVGYGWIDTVSRWASERVSEVQFSTARERFPFNTPTTREAFYYRELFEELFPGEDCARTVQRWIPRTDWGCPEDPSGRWQEVHCGKGNSKGEKNFV